MLSDGRALTALSNSSWDGCHATSNWPFLDPEPSVLSELLPTNDGRSGGILNAHPNSNLIEARSVVPTLYADIQTGETRWFATAVFAITSSVEAWREDGRRGWDDWSQLGGQN